MMIIETSFKDNMSAWSQIPYGQCLGGLFFCYPLIVDLRCLKLTKTLLFDQMFLPFKYTSLAFMFCFPNEGLSGGSLRCSRPTHSTEPFEYGCAKTQTIDSGR